MRAPFPIENKNPQRVMLCGSFTHDTGGTPAITGLRGACASNTPAVVVATSGSGKYTLTLAEAPSQIDCVVLTVENDADAIADVFAHASTYTAATGVLIVYTGTASTGAALDLPDLDRLNFLIVYPKFDALKDQ